MGTNVANKVEKSSTTRRNNGGRKKGVPNKNSLSVELRCQELGVDIVEGLVAFYKGDYEFLGLPETIVKPGFQGVEIDELSISADLRLKALSLLAKYIFPTKKAIEHSIDSKDAKTLTFQYIEPKNDKS